MLLLAFLGCIFWYLVALRLLKLGARVKLFATPRDTFSMFREYRKVAPTKGWSGWPIAAFWFCVVCMFIAGIAAALTASARSVGVFAMPLEDREAIYIWVALCSFCFAIVFSCRAFRKISGRRSDFTNWKKVWADSSIRSDLYLAALGSLAFAGDLIALFLGQFTR